MERAEIARVVNESIIELAARSGRTTNAELVVAFLCECGCLGFVDLTIDGYRERSGAFLGGHDTDVSLEPA